MKYRSKPAEIEAMRWEKDGNTWRDERQLAGDIVHWIEANGGEARMGWEIGREWQREHNSHIAARTINGWAYAAPGHYVVMGSVTFCPHAEYGQPGHECDGIVDFYPCDPETFDKRWEPVS